MSRVWGLVVALWFSTVPAAFAQGGLFGLPLVTQKDGWARYVTESSEGPTEVVFKAGTPGSHKGKKGQWVILEVDAPGVGRISMHFLVAGQKFSPDNLLVVRVHVPGQEPQESGAPAGPVTLPPVKLLGKHTETIAGRKLEVTEYALGDEAKVGWSPSVAPLGVTYVTGARPMRLVAFGVGGDPWKGAGQAQPHWPEDKK